MRTMLAVAFGLAGLGAQSAPPAPVRVVRTIDLTPIEPVDVPSGSVRTGGPPAPRALAISSDGRWLVAVMEQSVVAIRVEDGTHGVLPVVAANVRSVVAAGAGPDVVLVTEAEVQRWDAARGQRLRSFALPTRRQKAVEVRQACAGPGSLVALRGWFAGSEPWIGMLDHDMGRWREFAFPHGSMDWSTGGDTLVVGTGSAGCCSLEPSCVRLVRFDRDEVQHVPTPGFFSVTCVPGGSYVVSDTSANAFRIDGGQARPIPGVVWGPSVALSRHWLLVAHDDLVLRTFDARTVTPTCLRGRPWCRSPWLAEPAVPWPVCRVP